jgi:hypothetical protein
VWLLPLLTALWANLHAGFTALPVCLGLMAAGRAAEAVCEGLSLRGTWLRVRRLVLLLAACTLATLLNPYGLELHRHIASYLRSDWIRDAVEEFQSPKFRGESALHFEILLFAGLALAYSLARRRRLAEALLVVFWAHAALVSVRHIPVYVVVAGPILCAEASRLWREWADRRARGSLPRTLLQLAGDLSSGFRRTTLWAPAAVAALMLAGAPLRWPEDFPEEKFPVRVAARQARHLAGARVVTSDQWGDYLLYRFYPRQRVFIDGRSDFYGRSVGRLYLKAAAGHPGWRALLDRQSVAWVLAPPDWPLAGLMRQSRAWRVVDEDRVAVLFGRTR